MPGKAATAEATAASNGTPPSPSTASVAKVDGTSTTSPIKPRIPTAVDRDADRSSDAETEPLPFDDDEDADADADSDIMDPATLESQNAAMADAPAIDASQQEAAASAAPTGLGDLADVSMSSSAAPAGDLDVAMEPASQAESAAPTSTRGFNSTLSSPQKTGGGYTGDEFSAESDLTDEPDDDDDEQNEANDDEDDEEGGNDDLDDDDEDNDASSLSDDLGSDDESQTVRHAARAADGEAADADGDADADAEADGDDDDDEDEDGGERRSQRLGRRGAPTRSSPRKGHADNSEDDEDGDNEEDEEDDDNLDDDDDDEAESEAGRAGEDEAAEALAALTGAGPAAGVAADAANNAPASDVASTVEGLEGLAALASAGIEHAASARDAQGEDSQQVDGKKPARVHQLRGAGGHLDTPSSDITPEPEDEEGELSEPDDEDSEERKQELAVIASMKKRAAITGGAVSLLEPDPTESQPGSAASSRAPSEVDEDDKADKAKELDGDEKAEADGEPEGEAETATVDEQAAEADTPAAEVAEQEEDTSTDEAAIRRQEAMEALTKIEIGFAMLRDRLYVERLEEISKEGEMISDGTHPELQYLTNAIELRRQRRIKLVEMWFEQQGAQYERVAKAEEAAAWSVWRTGSASLRRDTMDDYSRKRRKLDREKRLLDAPRPVRRHQVFETELVRNPDRLHPPMLSAAKSEQDERSGSARKRKTAALRRAMAEESEAANEYVAYPDLKGLGEADVWMDIERMGIRPVEAQAGAIYDPFYGVIPADMHPSDVHAMYGPEAAAAAAAAAAAQMGIPPSAFAPAGYGGGRMPFAPGTPGAQHTPTRHPGAGGGPAPMHGYDAYVAAELEHAHMQQQHQQQQLHHHHHQQHLMHRPPAHHELIDAHGRAVGSPYAPEMYGYPPPLAPAHVQHPHLSAPHLHGQQPGQVAGRAGGGGGGGAQASPSPRPRGGRKSDQAQAGDKEVGAGSASLERSGSGRGRGGTARGASSGRGRSTSSKQPASSGAGGGASNGTGDAATPSKGGASTATGGGGAGGAAASTGKTGGGGGAAARGVTAAAAAAAATGGGGGGAGGGGGQAKTGGAEVAATATAGRGAAR